MRTTPTKCTAGQVHASGSRGKSCVIMTHLLVAIAWLLGSSVLAAPIRSGKDWAIHPLSTPADWQALVQPENLAAGKRVQAEPAPNDWNTGSDLGQLTDGVLAGADGRMWSDKRAVAQGVAANRARMKTNDIIPWLTTGCYGDYDPRHTRDMVLEALANGSRGITYYWYGHFDAAHFKYHAEALDIAAPVEDIFMDGQPVAGLQCSHKQVKLCGMGLDGQLAVLVSNDDGLAPDTPVTVRTPAAAGTPVWDLHSGQRIGQTGPDGSFAIPLGHPAAHLYFVGQWDRLPACRPWDRHPACHPVKLTDLETSDLDDRLEAYPTGGPHADGHISAKTLAALGRRAQTDLPDGLSGRQHFGGWTTTDSTVPHGTRNAAAAGSDDRRRLGTSQAQAAVRTGG